MILDCALYREKLDSPSASSRDSDEFIYPVSPVIWPECNDTIDFQMGVDLDRILDSMKAIVVVVDQTGAIQTVNDILKKDLSEIEGYTGRNVFECAYARLSEGCGKTTHCSGCTIRRTVIRTFQTGVGEIRVPVTVDRAEGNDIHRFDLFISTEKVMDWVFLQIDVI